MKRIQKITGYLLCLISILCVTFSIYSFTLLNKIETFYRIMTSIILFLILLLIINSIIDSIKRGKSKKLLKLRIVVLIYSLINIVIGIVIFKVYNKFDYMNKEETKYTTVLISLKEYDLKNIKDKKIGIIENKEDINGNILPLMVIDKNNLDKDNEIIKESDVVSLLTSLLNKEIDVVFVPSSYKSILSNIEEYSEDTKIYEITRYSKNYKNSKTKEEDIKVKNEITKPFTMLLLGVDSTEEGIKSASSYNGDTIMLLAVDPETMHVTMFSIPRDTYVTMACGGKITKINHAAWNGTSCMVKTVEKFTGLDVDYYALINFKGVVDLVDLIGGVEIDVPISFCEQNSNREFGDKEICLEPGVQTLDGEQALAFARHRKTLALGDFQRGQNQQLVIEGMVKSLKNLRSVTDFYKVFDAVSKNVETSMSAEEMLSLYNVLKKVLLNNEDIQLNITKTFLTGYDLYVYDGGNSYTFQYYKQSLNDIVDALKINLGLKEKEEIKEFTFSIKEPYEREIVGKTYYNEPKKELVPDLTTYTLTEAKSWASKRNIELDINYVESSSSTYKDGQITSQDVHKNALLEKYSKITINVIKKKEKVEKEKTIENEEDSTD